MSLDRYTFTCQACGEVADENNSHANCSGNWKEMAWVFYTVHYGMHRSSIEKQCFIGAITEARKHAGLDD